MTSLPLPAETTPVDAAAPTAPADEVAEAAPTSKSAREKRLDRICLGAIGAHITIRTVAGFSRAYLLRYPLMHLLVTAGASALISGGAYASVGQMQLWVVLTAALVGLAGFDLFYWWAGKRYEHRISNDLVKHLNIPEKRVRQGERLMGKHGAPILLVRYFQPIPNAVLQLLAGAGKMPLWKFAAADVLGALLWAGTLVAAGWAAGDAAIRVVEAIAANALKVTIGIVVLAVAWNTLKENRKKKAAADAA